MVDRSGEILNLKFTMDGGHRYDIEILDKLYFAEVDHEYKYY